MLRRMAIDPHPPGPPPPRAAAYRRLLLPFEDGPASRRALQEAVALAGRCGATLEILALFEPARHLSGFEPAPYAVGEVLPRARARLAGALDAAARMAAAAGVATDVRMLEGEAIDLPAIVARQARETGADLVVMGTRGRDGLDRFLLGSVAEGILRRSPVPVLLVRAPDAPGA